MPFFSNAELMVLAELQKRGVALVIFTPQELQGIDRDKAETIGKIAVRTVIDCMKEQQK